MPNAMTIYGFQHLTHNLNADVHGALSYWDTFFTELKNLAGLLCHPGRRAHLVVSCVRGSSQAVHEHRFKSFDGNLYEKRWRLLPGVGAQILGVLRDLCVQVALASCFHSRALIGPCPFKACGGRLFSDRSSRFCGSDATPCSQVCFEFSPGSAASSSDIEIMFPGCQIQQWCGCRREQSRRRPPL